MRFVTLSSWGLSASALALASIASPAVADAPPANTAAQPAALEQIVVTAQRREEKLQDVPIAVTAVTAGELATRGIENAIDMNSAAPNLLARANPGANGILSIGIRGSISGQPAIWADTPIGMYLDGVYLGKAQGNVFDLADIERIEVLRGPQGTLFGRNTEGGAVSFVSRQPSGEFRGSAEVDMGNYGHDIGKLSIDLPKLGFLSATIAARKEKMNGWAENLSHEGDPGAINSDGFRAALKFDFTDRFKGTYAFDYARSRNVPTVSSLFSLSGWNTDIASAFGAIGPQVAAAMEPYVTTHRPDTVDTPEGLPLYENSKNTAHTASLTYEITDTETAKYIFSRRNMDYNSQQSISGMPLITTPITVPTGYPPPYDTYTFQYPMTAYYSTNTQYQQTSNELQWLGNHDTLHYVVGLYDFKDSGETQDWQWFGLFGAKPERVDYAPSTHAKAAYGQFDWEFVKDLTLTAGIRYTKEDHDGYTHAFNTAGYRGDAIPGGDILPKTPYSASFSGTTPMGAL
ncbi:MAG TPA: TonB-dependent receptor, partial [Steroidobacteraceae bacterium]|nr:TonB-dependent receptor [Steroidobacteraceae bacterium]